MANSRIIRATVCLPLATSPPNGPCFAAMGSTWKSKRHHGEHDRNVEPEHGPAPQVRHEDSPEHWAARRTHRDRGGAHGDCPAQTPSGYASPAAPRASPAGTRRRADRRTAAADARSGPAAVPQGRRAGRRPRRGSRYWSMGSAPGSRRAHAAGWAVPPAGTVPSSATISAPATLIRSGTERRSRPVMRPPGRGAPPAPLR